MAGKMDISSHKIMAMEADKRQRILSAAMSEFCKGFKSASTDAIVKEAGISKGLLFHYFGTKRELYEFTIWYAFDVMVTQYLDLINPEQSDLLESLWQMILLKLDLSYKYPAVFEFLTAAYINTKDDPEDEFPALFGDMQKEVTSRIFGNINKTLFRDDIDVDKTINIIWWSLVRYADAQTGPGKTMGDYQSEYGRYLDDIKGYFDIFKKVFYKQGQ